MATCCEWCQSSNIKCGDASVYWELPDGTRAIEISEAPSVFCYDCQMTYQPEEIVKSIEDQLMLINTKGLDRRITYGELMKLPRILKRNYFDFF